jgi:hypothetical protein
MAGDALGSHDRSMNPDDPDPRFPPVPSGASRLDEPPSGPPPYGPHRPGPPASAPPHPEAETGARGSRRRRLAVAGAGIGAVALVAGSFGLGRQSTSDERVALAQDVDRLRSLGTEVRRARDDAIRDRAAAVTATAVLRAELDVASTRVVDLRTQLVEVGDDVVTTDVCVVALDAAGSLVGDMDEAYVLYEEYLFAAPGSLEEAELADQLAAAADVVATSAGEFTVSSTACEIALDDLRAAASDALALAGCEDQPPSLRANVVPVDPC